MTAVACPPAHTAYLSGYLAANAVTLHLIAHPHCQGFHSWPCGDHHHVGHSSTDAGDACKAGDTVRLPHRRRGRR